MEKDVTPAAPAKPAAVQIPRSYALVIGISQYKSPGRSASSCSMPSATPRQIYSILISPEGGNFRAENVHTLIGPKATLAAIRRELEEWLPSVAKEEDRVLVYFAGHGFVAQGQAYLAPYDIVLGQIAKTAYPMATLGAVFGKIKAKSKVLLTDSCHSGAVAPDSDVQTINRSLIDLTRSVFSLTASRDRERSFESPDWGGGHGIFTYYVVRGTGRRGRREPQRHGDRGRAGRVRAAQRARGHRRQAEPDLRPQPASTRTCCWRTCPSRAAAGAPPPPKFGALIIESNMDGVEVFLDGKSVGVVSKGQPLRLPGLAPGSHTIQGVKMGYEPDGPREEMVYPGQEKTVSIRIMILRRRNKAAADSFERGLEFYNKGYEENYRRAAENFEKALAADAKYSQAALYLGRTYNALFEQQKAQQFFRTRHRDRSGLHGGPRQLRGHAAGHRRHRRGDPAVDRGRAAGRQERHGAVPAGAGFPDEGSVPAVDRGGADRDPVESQQSRAAFLAGREPADERRLRRGAPASMPSICG